MELLKNEELFNYVQILKEKYKTANAYIEAVAEGYIVIVEDKLFLISYKSSYNQPIILCEEDVKPTSLVSTQLAIHDHGKSADGFKKSINAIATRERNYKIINKITKALPSDWTTLITEDEISIQEPFFNVDIKIKYCKNKITIEQYGEVILANLDNNIHNMAVIFLNLTELKTRSIFEKQEIGTMRIGDAYIHEGTFFNNLKMTLEAMTGIEAELCYNANGLSLKIKNLEIYFRDNRVYVESFGEVVISERTFEVAVCKLIVKLMPATPIF